METLFPSTEYVRELENGLSYYRYLHWINYEFLSFPWILLTIIAILVIILWIKLVARKNLIEILLFGVLIAITGVTFDEFGYEYRFTVSPHFMDSSFHPSDNLYAYLSIFSEVESISDCNDNFSLHVRLYFRAHFGTVKLLRIVKMEL